jgi:hypothetical protein
MTANQFAREVTTTAEQFRRTGNWPIARSVVDIYPSRVPGNHVALDGESGERERRQFGAGDRSCEG